MQDQIDDGRGLYPDTIRAKAPLGMRKAIQRAAAVEGVSAGEFVRRAVRSRVEAVAQGKPVPVGKEDIRRDLSGALAARR
jgi:hypothetical protein